MISQRGSLTKPELGLFLLLPRHSGHASQASAVQALRLLPRPRISPY